MCSLYNIAGIIYKPLKIQQTATNVMEHLNRKLHQINVRLTSVTTHPGISPSVTTNTSPKTVHNVTEKLIEGFLQKYPKTTTLVKKNCRFLQVQKKNC